MDAWPLVGRAEELRRTLDAVITPGVAGIVLFGAAGVGKTRLAREAVRLSRRRGSVCRTVTATRSAQSVPLGVFVDYATELGTDPLARIRHVVDTLAANSAACGQVVVIVDDAHLLDEQSALVVHHLVSHHRARVILTVRRGEEIPDAIRGLWKDELVAVLDVQPLSLPEITTLVENSLGGQLDSASAQYLWQHTRGNVLLLRQLLADELAAEHVRLVGGVYVWTGQRDVSPTLAELITAAIGRQRAEVVDVLDVLAVGGALDLDILTEICADDAIIAAEAAGVINIDDSTPLPIVLPAHPLYCEARIAEAPALRLRQLRGEIAAVLRGRPGTLSLVQQVRLAALTVDSDVPPRLDELIAGSRAAAELMDTTLAERLACAATHVSDSPATRWLLFSAYTNSGHFHEAESVGRELRSRISDERESTLIILHCALSAVGGRADLVAWRDELAHLSVSRSDNLGLGGLHRAVLGVTYAVRSEWQTAAELLTAAWQSTEGMSRKVRLVTALFLVLSLAVTGRTDQTHELVHDGSQDARLTNAVGRRYRLMGAYLGGLEIAGYLTRAKELAREFGATPADHPIALAYRALILGNIADSCGDVTAAQRWLREANARFANLDDGFLVALRSRPFFIASPDPLAADPPLKFTAVESTRNFMEVETPSNTVWPLAVRGAMTEAVSTITAEAAQLAAESAYGSETLVWQTAAQLGSSAGADRLAVLSGLVDGPRVHAACAHAAALASRHPDQLLDAASMYEDFGDLIAAADGAAQAAVEFRRVGRRGAALTAAAMSDRIAAVTNAYTPARKLNDIRVMLTDRQREILSLAASGMSNWQIAEQLTISVRTVEGHIFRAAQRAGVSTRTELTQIVTGRR